MLGSPLWKVSNRFDPIARDIADRHYNRRKVGSPRFCPAGAMSGLLASDHTAFWVTSWPFGEYVKSTRGQALGCVARFVTRASAQTLDLIRAAAIAATRTKYGEPPDKGMVELFINRKFVRPYITPKGKEIYGQTFRPGRFHAVSETKGGLLALRLFPMDM